MEIVIGIIIGLAIGFFVGKLMEAKSAGEEKTQLVAKAQVLAANIEQIKLHHASEVQSMKSQMENERLYAAKLRAESDQQWAQKLESLKQEMQRMTIEQQKVAAEQLAAKQSALQENNRLQMDELLKPIKEQFADFKKSVEESKTQNEVNKKELQNTFEATMKLFQQEQQQAVLNLKEQTEKIGSDAANLTKALKGDSKMQGDWGEMVLETILENSGLRKDEEFFIQENTKDEEGKNYRPDVIVRFPEGRSVVIDSKVSLTAYSDALAAEDEAEQERLMKAHALSVRKHIDELAAKDYSKLVDDAIGFVLMFIPNEVASESVSSEQIVGSDSSDEHLEPTGVSEEKKDDTVLNKQGQTFENVAEAVLNPQDQAFVDKATRLVLTHLSDTDFNIDRLCREMAMSRTLFYGRLKTLTGQSPQDFMRLIRLEQAAIFLKQGDSVLDVSVKAGFVNVKYFSTVFKKHFGVSPSKYL